MLCDYIIAALQAMISVIIVIGIRVRLRKTITHVTLAMANVHYIKLIRIMQVQVKRNEPIATGVAT